MQAQEEPSLEKPSLYDRLGGVYNIATVIDDLIDRVMVDPRLNANPRVDEAHHRVSAAGFKYLGPRWPAGRRAARKNTRVVPWATRTGIS
jgi:hypothetical protein